MAEKQINGRIVHKHDIEANWNKAINFIPKNGEIIIYDPDSNYSYARVKVGDGTTKVTSLPFIDNAIKTAQTNLSDTVNSVKNNSITGLSVSGQTITYTKGNGTTGTITTQDNNTTYSAGTGLSLSGTTFNHKNSITAATAQGDASKTLAFGDTFTIPTITYDAQGHITGKGTTTMTMPANPNSDTKVTQIVTTSNASYPLLLAPSGQTATATTTSYFDSGVTLNPSTNTIATNISGNAATATQLATARTIQTNLGSTSPTSFNGTANITPGVTGTLSVANGGTGATTASGARTTLEVPSKTGDGASGTWGISISGNAAASTLASYTLKMQTYKIGSTTETYGTSYPLYAQWENNKVLRLRCDNSIVKTDIAQCLTYDDSFDLNRNSLQYFNISGSEGSAFKVNDAPTSAWWHIMRCTHNNSTGYYTDLAIPFNDIGLHYKRVSNGTVQNNGWIKVLDTLNYNSYSPTLTGGGASGTWGINVTGSSKSIFYSDQLTTDDAINAFNTGSTFQVSTWNNTSSPGVSNGIIINAGWTNATYGAQIVIDDDPTYYIALRQKDNNGWNAWKRIPMGDGTGASGTWGINISGNAGSVAWENITEKPSFNYLPLSGGTLTGYITLQNDASYPRLLFKSSSYDGSQGEMFYRILSDEASSNFLFRQYCRSSEDYSLLSTYEDFKLPQTTADRAYSGYYDILTTKSAVTVSQGGTGATTAAGARTNLGAYPQADMVFTTGGSEQTTSIKFDGKTVYRKVYSIGAVSANATKQIDTGLTTTIDIIFNLRGVARLSESQYRIPMPYTSNQSGYNYSLQMVGVGSTPKIQITAGTVAITSGFVILEYTKI